MSFPAWEGTVALFIVAEEQPARKARHCAAGVLFTSTPTPFCLAVVSCYIAGRRFFFFFFFISQWWPSCPLPGPAYLLIPVRPWKLVVRFSLLMSYWFIFALISYVGVAVAEITERMPVNGGTIVNHSYLRRYSLTMLVWSETTNIIVSPGLFAPHPQLISTICGFGMLPGEMFKKLQASCILLITTVGLLVLSVFLSVRQASDTATIFISSVTVGIPVLFLFSRALCAQSGCDHAPTVFRRHKSGVLSIVNRLAASSLQQVPEDLVILVYTGMISLSLLYFGHWQNSRLHGASSLGSFLGPGQTRVDQGSRRELQAMG